MTEDIWNNFMQSSSLALLLAPSLAIDLNVYRQDTIFTLSGHHDDKKPNKKPKIALLLSLLRPGYDALSSITTSDCVQLFSRNLLASASQLYSPRVRDGCGARLTQHMNKPSEWIVFFPVPDYFLTVFGLLLFWGPFSANCRYILFARSCVFVGASAAVFTWKTELNISFPMQRRRWSMIKLCMYYHCWQLRSIGCYTASTID